MKSDQAPRPSSLASLRGVTLIELMVTIAILAILMSLAVPSFNQVLASTRLSTTTNDLYATLSQAKSEAIRSGNRVTVCPSTDGATCLTAAGSNWANGWITFRDITRSGTNAVVDAGDVVTQIGQNVNENLTILGTVPYASFASDGTAKLISGAFLSGRIRVCSASTRLSNDRRARDISIIRSGRIEITTPTGIASTCPAPT